MENKKGLDSNIIDFECLTKKIEDELLDSSPIKVRALIKNEYLCSKISKKTYDALRIYLENIDLVRFKEELAETLESYHNAVTLGNGLVFIERLIELNKDRDLGNDVFKMFQILLLTDANDLDL